MRDLTGQDKYSSKDRLRRWLHWGFGAGSIYVVLATAIFVNVLRSDADAETITLTAFGLLVVAAFLVFFAACLKPL